ncbi:MAG: 3-isopropylmalate dehydratase small subunit [Acidimicrobiia bacterium]|nr:3-isopropylmalate dehydratase small subunit [Acidimicrobiia bacterium]
MEPVRIVESRALPLDRSDVDTDQIIPSHWLKRVERTGFDEGLFSSWREDPGFVLNDARYASAEILVAGPNFGTGSSREHAVWAIQQYGFRAVVSPRFGDIFRNNAAKCGLVAAAVDPDFGRALLDAVTADHNVGVRVDVEKLTVEAPAAGLATTFPLAGAVQERLLGGLDDIAISLRHAEAITAFEQTRPTWLPVTTT